MDDLQARLDRAITEARGHVLNARSDHFEPTLEQAAAIDQGRAGSRDVDRWIKERNSRTLDRYAALVALRARLDEHEVIPCDNKNCPGWLKLEREAERLLGEDA